jgi:hypothetical protein
MSMVLEKYKKNDMNNIVKKNILNLFFNITRNDGTLFPRMINAIEKISIILDKPLVFLILETEALL